MDYVTSLVLKEAVDDPSLPVNVRDHLTHEVITSCEAVQRLRTSPGAARYHGQQETACWGASAGYYVHRLLWNLTPDKDVSLRNFLRLSFDLNQLPIPLDSRRVFANSIYEGYGNLSDARARVVDAVLAYAEGGDAKDFIQSFLPPTP